MTDTPQSSGPAPTAVRFWFDPACPFCWVTSKWLRSISDERNLDVTWEPISLLIKNQTGPDSPFYERVTWTRDLLRVVESVRAHEGNRAVGALYLELGRRIHHDQQSNFDAGEALQAVGLPTSHAAAAGDATWDAEIERKMADAFELVGTDVGTPIHRHQGRRRRLVGTVRAGAQCRAGRPQRRPATLGHGDLAVVADRVRRAQAQPQRPARHRSPSVAPARSSPPTVAACIAAAWACS